MQLDEILFRFGFFAKVAFVTICIWVLLSEFFPKYEFIDESHRCNRISGKVEYYSRSSHNLGWHE